MSFARFEIFFGNMNAILNMNMYGNMNMSLEYKLDVWNSTQDSSKYYVSQTKGGQQIKLDLFKLQLNLDKSLCQDKLLPPHQSYTHHSHGQTTSFTLSASLCLIKMPVNSDKSCAYSDALALCFDLLLSHHVTCWFKYDKPYFSNKKTEHRLDTTCA